MLLVEAANNNNKETRLAMLLKEQIIDYARVVGEPYTNKFDPSKKQWSFDLRVDKATQKQLLDAGMRKSFIRNKDERGPFISFVRDATRRDGSEGKPFKIVDHRGEPWDQNVKIGNGSVVNVIVTLNEREYNGQKFLKPGCISFQVWDLVPYEPKAQSDDGFPVKEDAGEEVTVEKPW